MSPCGQVYVGFVQRENEIMPAKIVPKYCFAYYPYFGKEYSTAKFTVNPSFRQNAVKIKKKILIPTKIL